MNKLFFLLFMLAVTLQSRSQINMRIHLNDGGHSDVPIEQIDSITFVNGEYEHIEEVSLTGSWLWGDASSGYYELLTVNADYTYIAYDNYFMYGFDTMTYGWYFINGSLLMLQSNGVGYNRNYTWFVMGLTENALDVMTKMGRFTYYKLQQEPITLSVGDTVGCADGESFVFADGVKAVVDDGRLKAIASGVTYVLVSKPLSNVVVAYKVVVE